MNKLVLVALAVGVLAAPIMAQDTGNQSVRGVGTVNQMSATPDQNQRLTGQQPLTNTGGPSADAPDNTDRVNGRAYPTSGGGPTSASTGTGAPGGIDQNSGAPVSDQAAVAAAKKGAAPNNSPETNPPQQRVKKITPSPGAEAKTKATTGGQTNDKRKQQ
jgi:hypothetical protein